MQKYLIDIGYDLGKYGSDGDFGECTEIAVMQFQRDHGCKPVDGEYGPVTHEALMKAIEKLDNKQISTSSQCVEIINGQCWIRTEPNTACEKLVVARNGEKFKFAGEIADNKWPSIIYNDKKAWVSNKYSRLIEA